MGSLAGVGAGFHSRLCSLWSPLLSLDEAFGSGDVVGQGYEGSGIGKDILHPMVEVEQSKLFEKGLTLSYVLPTQHNEVFGGFRLEAFCVTFCVKFYVFIVLCFQFLFYLLSFVISKSHV